MAGLRNIIDAETGSLKHDRKLLTFIILVTIFFKVSLAVLLPLGIDESYAISVAREYSLSFFDHPPVSFWLPVAFADLTGVEHPFVFRLPFLIAGVITTILMYLIGAEIGDSRVGVWTAILYAFAPFFLVSGGFMTVPDGPLSLASTVTVWLLVKITNKPSRPPLSLWILTGLALALAIGSKYQAAWIAVAVLLFLILTAKGRSWFFTPGPWLGGIVGLLGLAPTVIWNMQNDWASFAFHGGRAGSSLNLTNFSEMLVLQLLFLLPTGLVAATFGMAAVVRRNTPDALIMLTLIALGPILIFNSIYLLSQGTFAHWTMPGWQFAFPLAAIWLVKSSTAIKCWFFNLTVTLSALLWVLAFSITVHSRTGYITRPFYDTAPKWDHLVWVFNYRVLKMGLIERDLWQTTDLIMASDWHFAGILDTALEAKKPMQVFFENLRHHYQFLSDADATGNALFLEPAALWDADRTNEIILKRAKEIDPDAILLDPIILQRGGQPYISVSVVQFTKN